MSLVERAVSGIRELLEKLYAEALAALDAAVSGASAEEVARHAREAERLRARIVDSSVEVLARYQPVARELRRVTAYMEASYDLFRVARYALEVSRLEARVGGACGPAPGAAGEAARAAREMLVRAFDALRREDPGEAKRVLDLDEQVDRMYLRGLDMLQARDSLAKCEVAELLVLRHLERIADHAVYIASSAHFIATGRRLVVS